MTTSDFIISKLPKNYKRMYDVISAEVFADLDHTVIVQIKHKTDVRNSERIIVPAGSITNDRVNVLNIKSLVRDYKLTTLFS